MIILVIAGIWVAAIATHYVSVAWHRSKFAAKWEKPLAQEYEKSRKQAEERFYALLEYYDKKIRSASGTSDLVVLHHRC